MKDDCRILCQHQGSWKDEKPIVQLRETTIQKKLGKVESSPRKTNIHPMIRNLPKLGGFSQQFRIDVFLLRTDDRC